MMKAMFNTAGDGLWSRTKTSVEVIDMKLGYVADDKDFGELCVYFNTATWDTGTDGLIYTDRQFLAELNVPAPPTRCWINFGLIYFARNLQTR